MSVRCSHCPVEAENLPALAAHVRESHTSPRAARLAAERDGAAKRSKSAAPPESRALRELRSVMTNGREGSVARDTGAGYVDTGEREACEVCGNLDVLRPVARSTWSLDPERRTALVCPSCAGAGAVGS
jgi:hypothetical protein